MTYVCLIEVNPFNRGPAWSPLPSWVSTNTCLQRIFAWGMTFFCLTTTGHLGTFRIQITYQTHYPWVSSCSTSGAVLRHKFDQSLWDMLRKTRKIWKLRGQVLRIPVMEFPSPTQSCGYSTVIWNMVNPQRLTYMVWGETILPRPGYPMWGHPDFWGQHGSK